jgi:hypothetical protein
VAPVTSAPVPPTVVMTVSGDRPDYLAEVLATWSRVRGVGACRFGFRVEPGERVERCREVIDAFAADSGAEVHVTVHEQRLGVRANPHDALDWAFGTGAPFVVLCEEDIVVADDVLELLTAGAAAYADDPSVLALCAFSDRPAPQPDDVVTETPFSAWVWGTWADRWHSHLEAEWFPAARAPHEGGKAGWDFGVERIATARGLRFLGPAASRSDNIGQFGGVHALPEEFDESRAATFAAHRDPVRFRLADGPVTSARR